MKKIVFSFLSALLTNLAYGQIYHCTENGRRIFSDQPCGQSSRAIEVRPSMGTQQIDKNRPSQSADPVFPRNTQDDLKKRADQAVKRRLLDEEIYRKEQRIKGLRAEMDQKLAELREKKRSAYNNLAGATWEGSISQEMNAVVASYDSQIRSIESELTSLRSQKLAMERP